MNCKMEYRTKAAMRILMELTRKEALDLLDVLGRVQKKLYIGDSIFPFDCMEKEDAVINMKEMLKDEELDIPGHLRGHLEHFLELMITERAPMDKLISEYNSAFVPVMHYELFRPDEDGSRSEEGQSAGLGNPGTVPEEPAISSSSATTPGEEPEDKLEKESESRKMLSDIADGIVRSLMEQNMTFYEMLSVIDTAQMSLKAERASYRSRLETTPIKELWEMEEREQQEDE